MKVYAEFYHLSTGYIDNTIPPKFCDKERVPILACGDRSLIRLDARTTLENQEYIASIECKKRGYIGYKILRGGIMNAKAITELRMI